MKALILSLLLLFTANAQRVWYVDRDATGGDTGKNWANAWTDFDSTDYWGPGNGINWAIIQPGDTIYVSGGSDSTTYVPDHSPYGVQLGFGYTAKNTFASGDAVVVTPAWHEGHNGDVYITAYGEEAPILTISNLSNIKFTGFTIIENRTSGGGMVRLGADDAGLRDSLIYFENNHVIGKGLTEILGLIGTKNTVKNCIIENLPNDLLNSQDPVTISGGKGGHTIDGNLIICRNGNNVTNAHRDGIQISNLGYNVPAGMRLTMTIKNNLFIDTNPEGTSWNNMLYNYGWTESADTRFLIYNNIFVNRKLDNVGAVTIGRYYEGNYTEYNSIYFLNNTIITKGGTSGLVATWAIDTLVMKNNLFIKDTSLAINILNLENTPSDWTAAYKNIDYNYYAAYGGLPSTFAFTGVYRTWAQWQSDGFDSHGSSGNSLDVTFDNKYDTHASGYYTATGRDAGENLWDEYPFLRYDNLGNERPQIGAWDIGALEFTGGQSNNVRVRGKLYLQGPFGTSSMTTGLNQASLIPISHPYNQPPWNYNGNESFNPGSNSSVVDWILVELRSSTNPSQIVARRAAVLKNDGTLLELNGSDGVLFNNVDPGSYYIAIYHRNHLAVMSAAPVPLSSNSALYDFTTAMNKAYGQNPMVELATGKYGMYATDGNADGVINTSDRDNVWLIQNGNMGYLEGDFNMNSGVTVHDVNQLWNLNNGAVSQVP